VTKHNSQPAHIEAMVEDLHQQLDGVTDPDEKTERIARWLSMPAHASIPSDGPRKRGRPITARGALYREFGISRLDAWKWMHLAEIPEEQFTAYLEDPSRTNREISTDGILRHFDKLSPDKPRPPERARDEAIQRLIRASEHLEELDRKLREIASDEELAMLTAGRRQVLRALWTLAQSYPVKDLTENQQESD
jgi:hypothetical protein